MTATTEAPSDSALAPPGGSSHRTGRWTEKEKNAFRQGLAIYGNASFRWKRIAEYVGTRTAVQCKTHHQKLVGTGVKTKRGGSEPSTDTTNNGTGSRFKILLDATQAKGSAARGREGGTENAPESGLGTEIAAIAPAPVLAGSGGDVDMVPAVAIEKQEVVAVTSSAEGRPNPAASASASVAPSGSRDENGEPVEPHHGRWTDSEKRLFAEAMSLYGRGRWKLVSKYVGTRTSTQCKTHHQKVAEKMKQRTGGPAEEEGRFDDAEEVDQGNWNSCGQETQEAIVAKALVDYRKGVVEKDDDASLEKDDVEEVVVEPVAEVAV